MDDEGRSRLRAGGEDADRARTGSGRGGRAWEARRRVFRVPDGRPHELAGAPVPLPIVAATGVRVSQTRGEAGIRLAHGPAAGRPPSGAALGGGFPPRSIPRLAVRS